MFRITVMLEYDMRRVEMISFNCLHDPISKNAKIRSLYYLPLYLAHAAYATGSHTTPHKIYTTSMFNYLTHIMSL